MQNSLNSQELSIREFYDSFSTTFQYLNWRTEIFENRITACSLVVIVFRLFNFLVPFFISHFISSFYTSLSFVTSYFNFSCSFHPFSLDVTDYAFSVISVSLHLLLDNIYMLVSSRDLSLPHLSIFTEILLRLRFALICSA